MRPSLNVVEGQGTEMKQINRGRSLTMRHVPRAHLVDLDRLYDRLILFPMIHIKHVNSTQQVTDHSHKRIIHRTQMDTAGTGGEHHDPHHTYSKQCVSFFCSCESLIFQPEQTWRIFRCSKRETKASSF